MPGRPQPTTDVFNAELDAATAPLCSQALDGAPETACLRAAGHAGAALVTDAHIYRDSDGQPVMFADPNG